MAENGNGNGSTSRHWQVILGAAGVCVIVIGGMWAFISQISAMSSDIAQLKEKYATVSASGSQTAQVASDNRSSIEVLKTNLKEIETQFRASDVIRNLTHSNQMRIDSLMWGKVFPGTTLPTDNAYYPQISDHTGEK